MAFLATRIAIYALISATFTGMVVAAYNNVYSKGETAERSRWELREASRIKQLAEVVAKEQLKQSIEHDKQVSVLNKALTNAQQDINNLHIIVDKRLFIPASKSRVCSNTVSTKAKNTSESSSTTNREQLPREIEEGLWRLTEDAQRVVIQYEQCRTVLKELVEINE